MGGKGSGSWFRFGKKATVENSIVLPVGGLRGRLYDGAAGTLTWTAAGRWSASIGYYVSCRDGAPLVELNYTCGEADAVRLPVGMQPTPTPFGGRRWWFVCPLATGGVKCGRRAAKLYKPPGSRYFGCRACHDLTYRSCQVSHQLERALARAGMDPGGARRRTRKAGR